MIATSQVVRISAGRGGPKLGKKQQRFNGLVRKVAQYKQSLRAWSEALPEIHRGVAEVGRLAGEHRDLLGELVRMFDRAYDDRRLTKSERKRLRSTICEIARDVLEESDADGDHRELKAIYQRHSRRDFDAEVAAEDETQTLVMKAMLEGMLGLDFAGTEIRSLEDLERATVGQLGEIHQAHEQRRQAADERRARRKKSARQLANEQRRNAERAQVDKALQEVYRRLAIALHPDREQDPAERTRKTELMQQVNVAYERNDLLRLLELQLKVEQVDQAQIDGLAEDRLDRYNKLLDEQVRELRRELLEIEDPWRMRLDLPPSAKLSPLRVQTLVRGDLRSVQQTIDDVRRDLEVLGDIARLKTWLASQCRDPRDLDGWFE